MTKSVPLPTVDAAPPSVYREAIADALEKSPRMTEGGLKFMVIDDHLALQWARWLRLEQTA